MSRAVSLAVSLFFTAGAFAQTQGTPRGGAEQYPSRQLRFVIPFSPGGGNDIVGRVLAQRLQEFLGKTVVVDNRGGVAGIAGADLVAKAPADGYTLLSTNISLAVNATLFSNLPYDTLKDFAPASIYSSQSYLLVIHPGLKARSVAELISLARATPGGLIYGSAGKGTGPHLAVELLQLATHTPMTHVPYRGGGDALNAVAGGKMEFGILAQNAAVPFVKSGRVIALAVTDRKRSSLFPLVPTMIEAGIADFQFSAWYALLVPAKTPKPIVERLNSELAKIAESASTKAKFAAQGVESMHTTPEQALAHMQSEVEKWGKVVKASGIKEDYLRQARDEAIRTRLTVSTSTAGSQNYPSRDLRLIVPYPPGGANDLLGKIMARALQHSLGKTVMIENRGGAGGTAGTGMVAKAPADGYTLLINNISLAINATLFPKLPYDTVRDLIPVSIIGRQPNVLLIGPNVKANTVNDLLNLARAKQGALIYGSGGLGSSSHLAAVRLQLATQTTMTHVPYQGLGPAMADLAAGKGDLIVATASTALPALKAGKVRALAVTTEKRLSFLPQIPTVIEAGIPDYEVSTWYSMLTPSRVPPPVITRLNSELAKITGSESVKKQFAIEGLETGHTTPAQALVYIKSEIEKWSKVVKASGAKPN